LHEARRTQNRPTEDRRVRSLATLVSGVGSHASIMAIPCEDALGVYPE
jgi:hypothetical protein